MKKLMMIAGLLACLCSAAWALSIFDIQYSNNPGIDNTYPSAYVGSTVSVEGVVTATDYRYDGFVLSETVNGPYRGILILDRRSGVSVGDLVRLTGTVSETYGMTCIQDITQLSVLDRNYPLPQPMIVSTGQIARPEESEAYEGVLVKVINISASSSRISRNSFNVTDGSGQCTVMLDSFSDRLNVSPSLGTMFSSIKGIVLFSHSSYTLNPVDLGSIQFSAPVYNQNRSWGRIKSIYR